MKKDENIYEKLKIGNSTEEIGEELNASIPAEIADAELGTSNSTEEINEAKTKNAEEEEGESMVYNEESEEAFDTESASIDASSNETDDSLSHENAPMLDAPLYQDSDTLPLFSDEGVYTETDLFGEEHIASESENGNDADQSEENGESKIENSGETDEYYEQEDDASAVSKDAVSKDTDTEAAKEQPEEKPRRVDSLFDFIELFVFTLAAVFIITSFFFRYSIVDGGSMQNTLQDKESLILRSIFYTPKSGDVIVIQDKSTLLKDPIVKRVIATEGQKVKFTRDAVYVDGVMLDEPYVYTGDYKNPFGGEDIYRYSVYPSDALLPIVTDREDGVFYEITIPDGEIFVMGDHRNNSRDSRDVGTLHEDAVIGKVVLRFLPFSKFGKIE